MDVAYLTAVAALAGSGIGGLTSFFSSWLSLGAQLKVQLLVNEKLRKEELYRAFVEEASKLYIDGLTSNTPDLSKTITLYALVSRMRIFSSPVVIEKAEKVARLILDCYPEPNRTFDDLRQMVDENRLDLLEDFANAARHELAGLARR